MTENSTNTARKHTTHKVTVSEKGVSVEPADKPAKLPKYASNLFRE